MTADWKRSMVREIRYTSVQLLLAGTIQFMPLFRTGELEKPLIFRAKNEASSTAMQLETRTK